MTSNPPKISKAAFKQALTIHKGSRYKREDYVTLLKLIYDILMKVRKEGLLAIEADLEKPEESKLFQQYPVVLDDHHMVVFITDCLRLMVGGNLDPHELESLLEYELETHHKEAHEPAHAVQKVADALPGFGIVAAVLGIVNTMGALEGADTATIGHKVGAALVGTFLGILMSYGFLQPLAAAMEARVSSNGKYEECIRAGIMAVYKGLPPAIAIEFARRVLPEEVRPSFDETEKLCRASKNTPEAAAA
jgi:chemotaxis protein MotA